MVTTYGSTVQYSCKAGYRYAGGDRVRTCGQNANWEGDDILCIGTYIYICIYIAYFSDCSLELHYTVHVCIYLLSGYDSLSMRWPRPDYFYYIGINPRTPVLRVLLGPTFLLGQLARSAKFWYKLTCNYYNNNQ